MFLHEGFMHILFNLLWLYFGGRIFSEFLGDKKLISTYILGGFAGAALYIVSFNIFPVFSEVYEISRLLGASASVLAVLIAISTYMPDYTVRLLFLGNVKLKYIAIFSIVLDILSIPNSNSGGHISHLGGALFGYLYVKQLQKGKDWSLVFYRWINTLGTLFKSKPKKSKIKVVHRKSRDDYEYNAQKVNEQERVDQILDKISKSGYDSLSKEEKDFLFKASQKR